MGRAPCCSKVGLHRGPWTVREDNLLISYIQEHGEGHWRSLPKKAGLLRCGKSCRLRWMNYLRPDIKRGNITPDEDDLIIRLHSLLGNRWSLIAGRLPGRTDNEIKNYWNSHLSKKLNKNNNNSGTNQKCKRESRKRNSKKKQKNDNIDQDHGANEEAKDDQKIKIHLPKAVRVSPSSVTRTMIIHNHSMASGSSSTHAGEASDTKGLNFPWCESGFKVADNDGEAWGSIEDLDDLVYDYDSSCQNPIPKNDGMLDELFEEYQQLLKADNHAQLDSFVDSLLA